MAPADVSNHSSNVEQTHNPVQSISKAMDIPVVKSAVFYASDLYQRVKTVNPLLESGLSRAEQTVLLVADSAKPVLRQLEGPINYADSLVCSGLDKLEEKVPAIKKSPEELKSVGWTTVEALRSYGTGRLDDIRGYVHTQVEKASSNAYAQAVLKTVDTAVHLTDHAIDMYLPAGEEEEKENQSNGHNKANDEDASQSSEQKLEALAQKVSHLSGKVRRRLSQYDLTSNRVFGLIRHQSAPAVASN